jgi:hypothetical protein
MPRASATQAPLRRKGALSRAERVPDVPWILDEADTEDLPYVMI